MIKIDNYNISNYENVTNENCPSFSGIVAGECKGNLWVDSIENPKIAIAESYAVGSFAFLGSIINNDEYVKLENYIRNDIFDFLKQKGTYYFEYSIESEGLKPCIQKMFEDKKIQCQKENSFRITERISRNYSLSDSFKMKRIDYDLWSKVKDGHFVNESFITNRLVESWGCFDNFEKKSVGFCITYLDKIVSVIIGTARFKNVITIDIETIDEFKHIGLGYALTIKLVNESIQRGLIVQWDCVESNPISRFLAEKAGFKLFKENEVFGFEI